MSRPASLFSRAAAATVFTLAVATPAFAEIQVEVNGSPVRFGGTPPVRVAGRVLIPLRAVVEGRGADGRGGAAPHGRKDPTRSRRRPGCGRPTAARALVTAALILSRLRTMDESAIRR